MRKLLVVFLSAGLLCGMEVACAAAANTDVRSKMTDKQKTELRKRAWDYCRAHYAGGGTYVFKVEIQSNGHVRCWLKG